jgi:hypothetical protein
MAGPVTFLNCRFLVADAVKKAAEPPLGGLADGSAVPTHLQKIFCFYD